MCNPETKEASPEIRTKLANRNAEGMASDHAIANGFMEGHGFSRAARNLKSAALAAGVLFRDTASK